MSQEVMAFTAKMNSKMPKEPIQTTEGDLKLLLKYKGYNTKLGKLAKKFELVQLLGSKLVESGHIQSVDHFRSDMSQMEQQWCLSLIHI